MLFVIDCSNEDETNQVVTKHENKIEEQQKEIQKLETELQQVKTDYSVFSQQADNKSRVIMRLIANRKFEELKKEYQVEFEVTDDALDFGVPESNIPFRIDLARHPMFISSFYKHSEATEISYYIDNLETEERTLITMHFDKDGVSKYIFLGDR